jgi:hypothetical protein
MNVASAPAMEVEYEQESISLSTLALAVLAPFGTILVMASPLILDAALIAVGL